MKALLFKILAAPIIFLLAHAGYQVTAPQTQSFGAVTPQYVAAKLTYLYGGGISSVSTSIKLTSLTTPNGAPLSTSQLISAVGGTYYATIEPSTTNKETVGCTGVTQNGDGTAIMTGCTRGLQFTAPYTASTTLALSHSGGSQVVLSDSPQLYNDILNYAAGVSQAETITGLWTFSSTSPPLYDFEPIFPNFPVTSFASVQYVNSVVAQGVATSTQTTGGIVLLATQLQQASSTNLGGNSPLVLQAKNATSSPNGLFSGLDTLILQNDGYVSPNALNGNLENYVFNNSFKFGSTTSNNSTSTISGGLFIAGASTTFAGLVNLNSPLNLASTTSTSTVAGNITVANNASTTNLTVSTQCSGCFKGINTVRANFQTGSTIGGLSGLQTVTCTGNQIVIGGGVFISTPGTSNPSIYIDSGTTTANNIWQGQTISSGNGAAGNFIVSAICVNP